MKTYALNNTSCQKKPFGFTLLELIVVVAIVALLGAASIPFYFKTIDRTERITVQVTANRFAAVVGLLRSELIIQRSLPDESNQGNYTAIELDDYLIMFNESGWPFTAVSTVERAGLKISNNEKKNCKKLWVSMIQSGTNDETINTVKNQIINNSKEDVDNVEEMNNTFEAVYVDDKTCRYRLITKRNSNYYFDFNLMDGRIITSVELLE
ncbi:MAG: prepilin-type N-terminal cleavage/methylation domain-containing protein [Cellvibrionaceae bacterium]